MRTTGPGTILTISPGRRVDLATAIVLIGAACIALVECYGAWVDQHETRIASAAFALLAIASAGVMLRLPASGPLHEMWGRRLGWLVVAGVTVWAAFVVGQFAVNGWDEAAYFSTALAWMGEPTIAATHRAPVTGLLMAATFGHPAWVNVGLLALLVVALWLAMPAYPGKLAFPVAVLMVFGNDQSLVASLNGLSELPAAVLLLAAFVALDRQRIVLAAALLALASLTRFNLAPVAVVVALFVWRDSGLRNWAVYACTGTVVSAVGMALLLRFTDNPVADVIAGNLAPVRQWTDNAGMAPTFSTRLWFYGTNAWFVGPVVVLLLLSAARGLVKPLGRPVGKRDASDRERPGSRVWLVYAPVALLTYAVVMAGLGPTFARFMTPIIPLAVVSAIYVLLHTLQERQFSIAASARLLWVAGALNVAWTLHPASFVLAAHENLTFETHLSEPEVTKLRAIVPANGTLYLYPSPALARGNGHWLMVVLRRRTHVLGERDVKNTPIGSTMAPRTLFEAEVPAGGLMLTPMSLNVDTASARRVAATRTYALWERADVPAPDLTAPGAASGDTR